MATDSPSHGGRRHFHRGRRSHDRRGGDRRSASQQQQQPQRQVGDQARGDNVDVEQIMRDIRSNIAQRHGVELTDQQVQELAARRLESILDPRTVKPTLLDQLRRAAGARPEPAAARAEPPYTFEDTTLFESPNAFVRFMRKLLAPILKLFFNPNPLIRALNIQAKVNAESVKREAERDQRQAEWNALHYEILQRVVSETAKVSLEIQSLALRVESLAVKVDFNERRVRGIEGTVHQGRPASQRERDRDRDRDRDREREAPPPQEASRPQPIAAPQSAPEPVASPQPESSSGAEVTSGEAPRRRRRRRRGRRGGGAAETAAQGGTDTSAASASADGDEGDEDADIEGIAEGAVASSDAASPNFETEGTGFRAEPSAFESAGPASTASEASAGVQQPAEAVTTEGESVVEPGAVPLRTHAVSLPDPEHELPPGLEQPAEPDHLLEPATTPDDSTPQRGPTGQ